ncbi:hypothetical protein MesoLj113b_69140 (plasmid) [Mesorhizobium sp. 113-3-3]|nr:hypothetical protein MesoLj113b_69140 [Mesorhizobium sp. 113-3-3]
MRNEILSGESGGSGDSYEDKPRRRIEAPFWTPSSAFALAPAVSLVGTYVKLAFPHAPLSPISTMPPAEIEHKQVVMCFAKTAARKENSAGRPKPQAHDPARLTTRPPERDRWRSTGDHSGCKTGASILVQKRDSAR